MPDAPRQQSDGAERDVFAGTLTELIELLFFAYRDFTHEADEELAEHGFGRAHHRVIYFVNRHPGLAVADLLDVLKITKQSLARVLKQLIDQGFIVQEPGPTDRRQRLLFATRAGAELAQQLTEVQMRRVQKALSNAGPEAESVVRRFLTEMVSDSERAHVDRLLSSAPLADTSGVQRRGATPRQVDAIG